MYDDNTKADQADCIKINVNEAYEVRDWSRRFGVTDDIPLAAVQAVGPMADDVAPSRAIKGIAG